MAGSERRRRARVDDARVDARRSRATDRPSLSDHAAASHSLAAATPSAPSTAGGSPSRTHVVKASISRS
jgi:hypothetical protein